jgi:hypothetical protein
MATIFDQHFGLGTGHAKAAIYQSLALFVYPEFMSI